MTSHDSYNAPSIVAAELGRRLGDNKNVKILDLGAGTGLVGTEVSMPIRSNINRHKPIFYYKKHELKISRDILIVT